jgi:hypothetical protein
MRASGKACQGAERYTYEVAATEVGVSQTRTYSAGD